MAKKAQKTDAEVDQDMRNILIIGSGMAGLAMAHALLREGIFDVTILEKESRLGGTWRDNIYPGCACDIPAALYSFSFFQNPDYSRIYPQHEEIQAYMENMARHFGIDSHIRYNAEAKSARWDKDRLRWTVTLVGGEIIHCSVLIFATGQLNHPQIPDIKGAKSFTGPAFHSARWNNDVDFCDKRVVCIGTGASAVQFVPEIAKMAKELNIFQRSSNWMIPRNDRPYKGWEKWIFRYVPFALRLFRWFIYLKMELRFSAWLQDSWMGTWFKRMAMRHLTNQISDPKLRKRLTPDYPVGCKRVIPHDDYYPTLEQDNVNVITDPIDHIEADAIVTKDGRRHQTDILIWATGFKTQAFLAPIKIYGANGQELHDSWGQDNAEAYLGIHSPGYPNMHILFGPGTGLGHNSILFMIECQVHYIMQWLREMRNKRLLTLDVRYDTLNAYNKIVDEKMSKTVWTADCGSWYKNAQGKVVNNWYGSTVRYWLLTRSINLAQYSIRS